jgi:hypothetical protein
MSMKIYFLSIFLFSMFLQHTVVAQQSPIPPDIESLKQEILQLRNDIDLVQMNLGKSHQRFKVGIAAATLGYTVTIVGGLMLGRENDQLGQALLVTGGAIGLTGTFLLVDSFKFLGRAGGDKHKSGYTYVKPVASFTP